MTPELIEAANLGDGFLAKRSTRICGRYLLERRDVTYQAGSGFISGREVSVSDLWKKLNLKDQDSILVLKAPESFQNALDELVDRNVHLAAGRVKEAEFFLAFVQSLRDVDRASAWVTKKTAGDAVIWMAYPKQTSKKYNCEFNRDTGWSALEESGLRGVRQIAIDQDWSAIRFRRLEFIK